MSVIDFILNLAAWILLVNSSMQFGDRGDLHRPLTLLGTLKVPKPTIREAWVLFSAAVLIVFFKSLLLHYLGAPLDTTMHLNFLLLNVFFKTGSLVSMGWMGLASFLKFTLMAYIWVWVLWRISRKDCAEQLVGSLKSGLGFIGRVHVVLQPILLIFLGMVGWVVLGLCFGTFGVLPTSIPLPLLIWQSLWISISAWMGVYWLLLLLMIFYLIHSYVYLGSWEGWDWIEGMGDRLLLPLKKLPLQWARIDFAPLVFLLLNWVVYSAFVRLILYAFQSRPF